MTKTLETKARRVRRGWLILPFAIALGVATAGWPQEGNPVAKALDTLRKDLDAKSLKDAGIASDGIVITVYNNNLTYIPSEYRVTLPHGAEKQVTWISWDGRFTLSALGTTPFEKVNIDSQPVTVVGGLTVNVAKATVQKGTAPGSYHLAVALLSGGKLYLDPNCPPIIIERVAAAVRP
jgi:hypothetical protein